MAVNDAVFIWPGMFSFQSGVVIFGSNITTGLLLPASDYINWGTTAGTGGYGIRDNAGTIEVKDSGGGWTPFPSGGAAPADATYIVQTANSGLSAEQALGALSTGVLLSTTTTGVVSSLGVGTVAQALVGGTTPAFGNAITVTALATTSTDGWVLTNTTAATGGATVQISPRLRLRGNAWDTAASETVDFFLENLPATAATPTGTLKFGYSLNGAAATYPATLSSAGAFSATTVGGNKFLGSGLRIVTGAGAGLANLTDNTEAAGIGIDVATNGTLKIRNLNQTAGTGNLDVGAKITAYNQLTTAGLGVPVIVAAATATAQSAANASIATYTVGAADGVFEVSMEMFVSAVTTLVTTMTCTYTDAGSNARTMILPVQQLAGSFIAAGAVTGTGVWETPVMKIRAKASTAITLLTSAGTFTGVTYSASGAILQIA